MKKSQEKVVLPREREETSPSPPDLLGLVASKTEEPRRPDEVVIGSLVGLGETGEALVDFPENPARRAVSARSTVDLSQEKVGREVALLFERGDLGRPVVIGFLRQPGLPVQGSRESKLTAEIDGEMVVLSADREIVLRCGKASITLTRAGKILLRGTYLLSRSSGVNRIKGGSVQLN